MTARTVSTASTAAAAAAAGSKVAAKPESTSGLVVSLGILSTVLWIVLSAAIFLKMEPAWGFGNALYFVYISVTSIGFGDLAPDSYHLILVQVYT